MPSRSQSVIPRMVVSDVAGEVAFLRTVFGGTGEVEPGRPVQFRVGDSVVMISEVGERDLFPAFLYVYVDDADQAYHRALDAGADSLEPPSDMLYGDRRAMVSDHYGNVFQIAHRIR